MAVNKYFHSPGLAAATASQPRAWRWRSHLAVEKSLYADLVSEAIHHRGHSVYYLDRTLVAEDTVLGEDALSKFNKQASIEMYMEDSGSGFGGQRELMSQFGLQNLSEATFVVSKTKFQEKTKQIQIQTATDLSSSGSIQLESGTVTTSSSEIFYIANETDATDSDRPLEGDAIYHPTLKKLFEINFVDHDNPFHQLDSNPVYKMRCRLFDYGSEELSTGITEIDAIADDLSIASSEYQITLENATIIGESLTLDIFAYTLDFDGITLDNTIISSDPASYGESILLETGGDEYIISEDYHIGDYVNDKTAQNELFDVLDDAVMDFSESNPFGDAGVPN
jgi:hypothetical protein